MNQNDRKELQELKEQVNKIADAQFEVSKSVSRILNLLEGDKKFGVIGHAEKINDHEVRITKIETDKKVFSGKVSFGVFIFSALGGFLYWLIDKFWIE